MFKKKSNKSKTYPKKSTLDQLLWFVENYLPNDKNLATRKKLPLDFLEVETINLILKFASARSKSSKPEQTNTKVITNVKYTTLHKGGTDLTFLISNNDDPTNTSNDTVCKSGVMNGDTTTDISPKEINIECDAVGAGKYLKILKNSGLNQDLIAIADLKVYGFDEPTNIIQPIFSFD